MYIVKLGKEKYVKEGNPYQSDRGINLVNNFTEGTKYKSIYDFLCAIKFLEGKKYDLSLFENITLINIKTLEESVYPNNFKVNNEDISRDLYVDEKDFELLKRCWYGSSHWLYIDDKWIAFENETENKQINKIKYYKRGLSENISMLFTYRNHGLPGCYSFFNNRKSLLQNEEMVKIALSNLDSCEIFNVYKKDNL